MNNNQLKYSVEREFKKQYNSTPTIITFTPGRVNIIGEHTDYNDGLAMPSAIDYFICIGVSISDNNYVTMFSKNYNDKIKINPNKHNQFEQIWKKLFLFTINMINEKYKINCGINMVVEGNIPIGCGLSSSTAFIISIVNCIHILLNRKINKRELALLCQKIENQALGTAGGRLDQYGIIFSKKNKFILIDFYNDSIEYISSFIKGCSWIIIDSKVSRELAESKYLQRVLECTNGKKLLQKFFNIKSLRDLTVEMLKKIKNSELEFKRLSHIFYENKRVYAMKNALEKSNANAVGTILCESHESLKKLFQVSCEEIDYIIEVSNKNYGWYGGRIIGGGFGGCSIHLVKTESKKKYKQYLINKYKQKFNIEPKIMNIEFNGGINMGNKNIYK